ncbi:MAG: tRNA (guanosine(37)-N1)-methyltransferase TrmD [Clostridia bacterium]|nr:tRNA (guanosine(37)-N1)-methyltransferase TrmD [Clostridia bacterium]
MRFDIMTLFPALVDNVLSESIIGRARRAGLIEAVAHNIRDYSKDKHRRVDDTPYGGGMGMLMAAPPVYDCYEAIEKKGKTRTIYMSPKGKVFTQKKARELSEYDQLIILCGHYEGVDQRVLDRIVDEEISVGDYVLTGGEIPACIVVDAVARLKDGVLSDPECYENESLCQGMLEYPQYTRPYDFMGETVPEVLLGGNHKEIEKWRFKAALELTKKQRPDLL